MKIDNIVSKISMLLKGEQQKQLDDIRANITTLGGGVLIQRGTISTRNIGANTGITVAITFDIPFDVAPTVVINHSNGGGGFASCMWDARGITTTGFSAYCWHSATGTGTVGATWIAIGTTSPMNQYDIYEEAETLIGRWKNKLLYRRVLTGTSPNLDALTSICTIDGCDEILSITGSIVGADNRVSSIPNYVSDITNIATDTGRSVELLVKNTNLANRPYTIIVTYTKT